MCQNIPARQWIVLMKMCAFFVIGWVILLLFPVSQAFGAKNISMPSSALRCELRGNDNNRLHFGEGAPNNMHFVLFSNQNGVRIYQESNSWGHGRRSFAAIARSDNVTAYKIERRERNWKKNSPELHTLNRGEFLITDINLCDGSWIVTPKLPTDHRVSLMITPKFQIDKVPDGLQETKWLGHIEGPAQEIELDKSCVDRLNGD